MSSSYSGISSEDNSVPSFFEMRVLLPSGMQKVTGGIVNLSLGWGLNKGAKALSEKEVVDNLYQLTTVDVKWQLARKDVYIDEEKVAALESMTGYRFDTQAFYEKMRNAIDQCGDRFYDNTWRNELMPHILKNLFMEETKKMYQTLAEQAQGGGILSEELLDQTLANGTRMMQDIMESYTRDLANKTPILAAPIRFVKEELAKVTIPHRVVVVANGYDAARAQQLADRIPEAVVLPAENRGFAAGNNLGVKWLDEHDRPAHILLTNNDIHFRSERVVETLVETAVSHPEAGAVGPEIIGPDGNRQGPEPYMSLWDRYVWMYLSTPFLGAENKRVRFALDYPSRAAFLIKNRIKRAKTD